MHACCFESWFGNRISTRNLQERAERVFACGSREKRDQNFKKKSDLRHEVVSRGSKKREEANLKLFFEHRSVANIEAFVMELVPRVREGGRLFYIGAGTRYVLFVRLPIFLLAKAFTVTVAG